MPFAVIPVLDVKDGLAVHAIGGIRDRYQPLRTILHDGSRPIDIARAYRYNLGLTSLYLADLDAIAGKPQAISLYMTIIDQGTHLLLDAGFRDLSDIFPLEEVSSISLVVALETIRGPAEARAIVDRFGPARVVFSLDQFKGRPLSATTNAWESRSSSEIAERVIDLGFERLILLDLARVGTGKGAGSLDLLRSLRDRRPEVEIISGGGVSGMADLQTLKTAGAVGVLVGSAFHDGRIGPAELAELNRGSPSEPHPD